MADYSQYLSLLSSGNKGGTATPGDTSSSTSSSSINFGGSGQNWIVPAILGGVVLLVALVLVSRK